MGNDHYSSDLARKYSYICTHISRKRNIEITTISHKSFSREKNQKAISFTKSEERRGGEVCYGTGRFG